MNTKRIRDLPSYKTAFTANAVRSIHELILDIWPPDTDIHSVLARAQEDVSGLYIGDYGLQYISRGIVRHSIYANKILIVDPFIYPYSVRDEFNPIIEPDQHRSQTLRNVNFWFSLLPWIEAGIVEIIRTPADFDREINFLSMQRQRDKFDRTPELEQALRRTTDELIKRHREKEAFRDLLLSAPDFHLKYLFEKHDWGKSGYTVDDFIRYIQNEREVDPDFLEPVGPNSKSGQLHLFSSGANYDVAQMTASITNSYLVTDLYSKWKEIELDRESQNSENRVWSPFAKAIHDSPLKYLNRLRLEHALKLRGEGHLESLRGFLLRVWKDARTEEPFEEANARFLAEELRGEIAKAEEEWKRIDQDLIKLVGGELFAGLLAAGPLIASGHGSFAAAAGVAAGTTTLAASLMRRRRFPDRFPAAFFMNIDEES